MGGAASEVSASTRTVVFESAYFKPASVRRTSKRLGLKTEASARFERGADINAARRGSPARARAGGSARRWRMSRADRRSLRRTPRPDHASASAARASRLLLGMRVPDREVERILARAGSRAFSRAPDGWDVIVADVPRGSAARSGPHRRSRPALRLRHARADVSADVRPPRPRPIRRPRETARPPRAHGGRAV